MYRKPLQSNLRQSKLYSFYKMMLYPNEGRYGCRRQNNDLFRPRYAKLTHHYCDLLY